MKVGGRLGCLSNRGNKVGVVVCAVCRWYVTRVTRDRVGRCMCRMEHRRSWIVNLLQAAHGDKHLSACRSVAGR
jgi:hypothetical protein